MLDYHSLWHVPFLHELNPNILKVFFPAALRPFVSTLNCRTTDPRQKKKKTSEQIQAFLSSHLLHLFKDDDVKFNFQDKF